MAKQKIKLMISSRCDDYFPVARDMTSVRLSEIRFQLKRELEDEIFLGKPILEVWINEDEPPEPGNTDSWDACLAAARDADIFLVLYNGNAGWTGLNEGLGICHAEFMTAFNESPGKVSQISLIDYENEQKLKDEKDLRFCKEIQKANLFRGSIPKSREALVSEVKKAVLQSLLNLAAKGAAELKKGRFNAGPALDWARLDFKARQRAMANALVATIAPEAKNTQNVVSNTVGATNTLFSVSAVPAAMTIAAAREMVGQPFLRDHTLISHLQQDVAGPVHVIACHRTVTEGQAMSMLGFPDATVISGSFGVYVADKIQKIQILFLANCRDESSVRHNWQRLVDWLNETGEGVLLSARAKSRARIVEAIASEAKN